MLNTVTIQTLHNNLNNLFKNSKNYLVLSITLLYTVINCVWLVSLNFKTLTLVVPLLILFIHLFSYFITIYSYSKFTTAIKYYWIRVFNLAWILEFYIFIVFIFMYIIAPNELQIFWDPIKSLRIKFPNILNINPYIITLTLIYTLNIYSIYKQYNMVSALNVMKFLLVVGLIYIFVKEFKSFIYYTHISVLKKNNIIQEFQHLNQNDYILLNSLESLKTSVLNTNMSTSDLRHHTPTIFILNMILSVKFVHVFLIIFITLVLLFLYSNNQQTISISVIGLVQQNLIILLVFWSLNYIIFFKHVYKTIVYGMYKTIGVSDFFNTIYYIFNELYLI